MIQSLPGTRVLDRLGCAVRLIRAVRQWEIFGSRAVANVERQTRCQFRAVLARDFGVPFQKLFFGRGAEAATTASIVCSRGTFAHSIRVFFVKFTRFTTWCVDASGIGCIRIPASRGSSGLAIGIYRFRIDGHTVRARYDICDRVSAFHCNRAGERTARIVGQVDVATFDRLVFVGDDAGDFGLLITTTATRCEDE